MRPRTPRSSCARTAPACSRRFASSWAGDRAVLGPGLGHPDGRQHPRDGPREASVQEDARNLASILGHPDARRHLDFGRPLAILIVSVLLCITDKPEATRLAKEVHAALPRGGYLDISHGVSGGMPARVMQPMVRLRTCAEVTAYFAGLELVPRAVVLLPAWRPDGPHDVFVHGPARELADDRAARCPPHPS